MLSSMLQGGHSDYPHHSPLQSQPAWAGQTRTHQSHSQGTSSNTYSQTSEYTRTSQRLPSPPDSMEEVKESKPPSLPGFKNLLSDIQKDEEQQRQKESTAQRSSEIFAASQPSYTNNSRSHFPPTPPLRPGSGFGEKQSPPLVSSFSSQQSYYPGSAINNLEPYNQRQMTYPSLVEKRPSVTSQGYSPFSSSLHGSPAGSTSSYQVSPIEASPSTSMLYQQRLPTNFPPPYPPPSHHHQMLSSYPLTSWQQQAHHHHSFPPSSSIPPYSQSPDRYLCAQCNKAFSRPSSLKIHMHSHTGEKPFKCGHPGCGKAFSVRSNMKRHEKGCHGDAPGVGQFVSTQSPGSL